MVIEFTLADMFLMVWAIIATVMYYIEKHNGQEFKFRTAVIIKALADGDAKFVKHGDGQFEIVKQGE